MHEKQPEVKQRRNLNHQSEEPHFNSVIGQRYLGLIQTLRLCQYSRNLVNYFPSYKEQRRDKVIPVGGN